MTTKIRTFTELPEQDGRAAEFEAKLAESAKAAQVHSAETRREVEEATDVVPEGSGTAHAGAVGEQAAGQSREYAAHVTADTPAPAGAGSNAAPQGGQNR